MAVSDFATTSDLWSSCTSDPEVGLIVHFIEMILHSCIFVPSALTEVEYH